jgi:hypothetical protein
MAPVGANVAAAARARIAAAAAVAERRIKILPVQRNGGSDSAQMRPWCGGTLQLRTRERSHAVRFSQTSDQPIRQVLMPSIIISPYVSTVLLLIGSNAFMTTAWYWHLRYKEVPLWQVILISWGLAFIEYCLAVPANRYGSAVYSAAQLKTIQEVVTLSVFGVFSVVYLHQAVTVNQMIGFALIAAGAFFVFRAPL